MLYLSRSPTLLGQAAHILHPSYPRHTQHFVIVHHQEEFPEGVCPCLGGGQALESAILALSDVNASSKVVELYGEVEKRFNIITYKIAKL